MGHLDKKIKREILEFKDIIDLMGLTDVYRVFCPANSTIYILLRKA
jgi:hypothetical protein